MNNIFGKSESVSEALDTRLTCRAFLNKEINKDIIFDILDKARRAPSGGNLQPWKVWAISGDPLKKFKNEIREKALENPRGEGTEYKIYPPDLKNPYEQRRRDVGEGMYHALDIPRDDKAARIAQVMKNFNFFGAPVGLFCFIDKGMGPPQWSDLGMFLQTFMLLAKEIGLDTCAQEAWSMKQDSIRQFLKLDEEMILFCGMAIGYKNPDAPINDLKSTRRHLDEWATFI